MHTIQLALESSWKVLLVSVILGAGVPALFAFGVRGFAAGNGAIVGSDRRSPAGKIYGSLAFAIVLAAVLLGLSIIISSGFGMKVSFEHIFPTFVDKK